MQVSLNASRPVDFSKLLSIIITNALIYADHLILDEFSTNPELSIGPISDAEFIVRFLTKFLQSFCDYFTFEHTYEPFVTVCQGEGFL